MSAEEEGGPGYAVIYAIVLIFAFVIALPAAYYIVLAFFQHFPSFPSSFQGYFSSFVSYTVFGFSIMPFLVLAAAASVFIALFFYTSEGEEEE